MNKVFVINAFTTEKFGGNPAAVVPLDAWPDKATMQLIAAQHNLAETAFVVPEGDEFRIRWFTPTVEVDLCGHATLAAAHVYFQHLDYPAQRIVFRSKSGPLPVSREADGKILLDFPVNAPTQTPSLDAIVKGLGRRPEAVYLSTFDYMAVFSSQSDVQAIIPDFGAIRQIPARGLIATAKGDQVDFVSRCFFPQSGIDEDPVTGSAHTVMVPYWSRILGKSSLSAIQLSPRKGYLYCALLGDRVQIGGYAKTYLEGFIYL